MAAGIFVRCMIGQNAHLAALTQVFYFVSFTALLVLRGDQDDRYTRPHATLSRFSGVSAG
jgi:hypothetical protein